MATKYASARVGAAAFGDGDSILSWALSAPYKGSDSVTPADSTPGMDRACSRASRIRRMRAEGSVERDGGSLRGAGAQMARPAETVAGAPARGPWRRHHKR